MTRPFAPRLFRFLPVFALVSLNALAAGPDMQQWTASTGAKVFFVEIRALPLVDVQAGFVAGSALDPADSAGLASLTRSLLDAGTAGLNEQEIAERIADTGAQFGGGTDKDQASLSLRTLSSAPERDAAVMLAASLLARPTFPQDILERERARSIAGLKDALTRPAAIAARSFGNAIYGNHPYGRSVTVESLERITRDEIVGFHQAHYTARNAVITVVGDVSRTQAETIAVRLTEALPAGTAPAPLTAPQLPQRKTERISHPSAQAHITMGMPGLSRDDPDYYPLLAGNYVLGGGGFVSRLTKEVREKRGLAYSVYSSFQPLQMAGPFEIGLQTRGNQAREAQELVERVLRDFVTNGPTEDELAAARDNIINGFGLRLDSNRKILDYVSMIGFYNLPLDWLDAYPRKVKAVTVSDVRDAFARRIKAENLITVIVGGDGDVATKPVAEGNGRAGGSN